MSFHLFSCIYTAYHQMSEDQRDIKNAILTGIKNYKRQIEETPDESAETKRNCRM